MYNHTPLSMSFFHIVFHCTVILNTSVMENKIMEQTDIHKACEKKVAGGSKCTWTNEDPN